MPGEPQILRETARQRLDAAPGVPFRLPDHDLGGGRHADRPVDVVGMHVIELRAIGPLHYLVD